VFFYRGGVSCFAFGFAVIESLRDRGFANETVVNAMDE
jgi:hypothetical protein